jgi:DNA polymerase
LTDELRAELAGLASSVRAFLELHDISGTTGLPVSESASAPAPVEPAPRPREVRDEAAAPNVVEPRPVARERTAPSNTPVAGDDERLTRLALLAERTRSCTTCILCQKRKQAVFARGNPFSELCFVGEGPGADEDAQGEPFVGKAGQLLDRMIAAMGYARDDVYICNIVKCRPPDNRKPEPDEMAACIPYLHEQLALVKPRAIIALGATAVQGLTGTTEGITRLRGKWRLYKGTTPIMPTFHPAYLLRTPAAKRDVWSDLQDVMRVLAKKQ